MDILSETFLVTKNFIEDVSWTYSGRTFTFSDIIMFFFGFGFIMLIVLLLLKITSY